MPSGRGHAPAGVRGNLRPQRGARILTAVGGALLLVYGMLTLFVASAWGPGNSDELISGGPGLVPWYGLSGLGTLAAVVSLALVPRPRTARWALLMSATSLAGWTAFVLAIPD